MEQAIHQRRAKGTGSISQRSSDGLWRGIVDVGWANGKRNRRAVYGKTREIVEQKVDALLALPAELAPTMPLGSLHLGRAELIAAADRKATHTVEQWLAKRDAVGCCVYCGAQGPLTVDHATPISRGGSNGIGNVVPACNPCNAAKHTRTAAEFIRERALGLL
jgi:5-methylcytosine-specific restriction endonuclease McrA